MTKGQRVVLWLAVVVGLFVTFQVSGMNVDYVPPHPDSPTPPPGYTLDPYPYATGPYAGKVPGLHFSFGEFETFPLLASLTFTFVAAYLALRKAA